MGSRRMSAVVVLMGSAFRRSTACSARAWAGAPATVLRRVTMLRFQKVTVAGSDWVSVAASQGAAAITASSSNRTRPHRLRVDSLLGTIALRPYGLNPLPARVLRYLPITSLAMVCNCMLEVPS